MTRYYLPLLLRMRDTSVSGADILDRASEQQSTVPYLGYGFSSFFGVALQRLFAKHPSPPRRMAHENTISAGLKELALSGMGVCWLPESLIKSELETGTLVLASQDHRWFLDLEIRLYRALNRGTAATDEFWETARAQSIQANG